MLIPHPLHIRIVEPTLLEWTIVEPENSEPHRWLGGYEHLKQAVELAPNDDLATRKLLNHILSRVNYATHELPDGYVGSPQVDLASLNEAELLSKGLPNDEERGEFLAEIAKERQLIVDYLRGR